MEHYLVNFIGITSKASALELVEVKEEIDKLKYLLKQEKVANAELFNEIDYSEKALCEV